MPITYIFHDCFLVSLPEAQLIFDYWKDPQSEEVAAPRFLADLDPDKPTYIFVSHSHKDHYNPAIFDWYPRFRSVRYIISRDVWRRCRHICSETSVYAGQKVSADAVTVLNNLDIYEDDHLRVVAFPSTDIGNSYMVEVKRAGERPLRIFHAGDLNAWAWFHDSTEQEIRKALGDYNACLLPIETYLNAAAANPTHQTEKENRANAEPGAIDVAFFPVDPRLGEGYATGARIFLERFRIGCFIPMHYALPRE
jgi:L-ascorbate metabolism protein UlaG (beta-lactamase superfamily)